MAFGETARPGQRVSARAPPSGWGEKVVAIVVLKKGESVSAEELNRHCRTLIGGFKVPKEISFAESLPISPTGKIRKRVLRDALWQGHARTIG